MAAVDERIRAFIRRHHVMTLAAQGGDAPWCCNLFYAYMPEENLFVYTSSPSTHHARLTSADGRVGASIVLESKTIGRLQGLQIQGETLSPVGEAAAKASGAYYRRFPYASLMPAELWILRPSTMKYTDNTLGFGTKLIWERELMDV